MSKNPNAVLRFLGIGSRKSSFPTLLSLVQAPKPILSRDQQVDLHTRNKIETFAKILTTIYKMNQRKLFDVRSAASKVVSTSGAKVQLQQGSLQNGTQAAHCAPCQILVNSLPVYDYIPPTKPILLYDVRGTFGRTDVVDTRLNDVDSLLERVGMVDLSARMVQQVFALKGTSRTMTIDIPGLQSTFQGYQHGSQIVHELSMRALEKAKKTKKRSPEVADEMMEVLEAARKIMGEHWPEYMETLRLRQFSEAWDDEFAEDGVIVPYVKS